MTPQISEISAEMLLGRLYPELEDRWTAHHDGTFYRNYSRDVMEVEPEIAEVWLSRDSILGLLPQGLISTEEVREAQGVGGAQEAPFRGLPAYRYLHLPPEP